MESLLWLAFLFLPGMAMSEFLALWRKEDSLSIRVAWAFAIGTSFNVALFFMRSFTGLTIIQTMAASVSLSILLLFISAATRRKFSFPKKPCKADIALLLLILVQSAILYSHFEKFPIFPQFRTADFEAHVRIATDYSRGNIPPLHDQLLYYGIYYILSPLLIFSEAEPLILIREGMGILVSLSPLAVYLASHHVFGNPRSALVCVAVWVLGGFVWHGMTLNTGLYPNFYSILSSFWLIAIAVQFARERAWRIGISVTRENSERRLQFPSVSLSFFPILLLMLLNALLSHYTILFIVLLLPLPLFFYARQNQARLSSYFILGSFLLPLAAGFLAFPQIMPVLTGFLTGGAAVPRPTPLSSMIPFPVLSHMVAEITNDFLSIFLLSSIATYAFLLKRRRNTLLYLPIAWLALILVLSPLNDASWRFAFVALAPLTLIGGHSLSKVLPDGFGMRRYETYGRISKALVFSFLVLFPTFFPNSWGATSLAESMTNTYIVAESERADLKAMKWIESQGIPSKQILSVTDSRFLYSELIISRKVLYAPEATVEGGRITWNDPSQVAVFASHNNIRYLILTKVMTEKLGECPMFLEVSLNINSTNVKPSGKVRFDIEHSADRDLTGALVIDDQWFPVQTMNGTQSVIITFFEGEHEVFAAFGSTSTERVKITVSEERGPPIRVGVPRDYCYPFLAFNAYILRVSTVYEDDYVKILKLGG